MLALLFPGQGSQVVGMGRTLADSYPVAAEALAEADDVLGVRLSELMVSGPEDELTATHNAQPAILAHSVAVLRVVEERLGPVGMAAGHSLGEFSAHVAAGTMSYRDALEAVRLRGELMYATGQARPGTMAAVLGLEDEGLEEVCSGVDAGICVPANFNAPGQVVISGDMEGVAQGMERAKQAGAKKVIPLKVSGAFHSPLMAPAADGLREKVASLRLSNPRFAVVSNVTAGPVTDAGEAGRLLIEQLTSPVRWSQSVRNMVESGVERFVELGPGAVLCGLNKRNARGLPCTSLREASDIETFGEQA